VAGLFRRNSGTETAPALSFGSWNEFPKASPNVLQVCHPDWRGVRTVAYSFQTPVVECDDLALWGPDLTKHIDQADIETVVIQGWPPGAAEFADRLNRAGTRVKCVLHSSPAQHGAEVGEAAVVDEVLRLSRAGVLAGVGMAKAGAPEAFAATGYPVSYVPNRVPQMPDIRKRDLGPGLHVGVFAEPFWRKNVTTQLLAVGMMDDAIGHVLKSPGNEYLRGVEVVEHGEMPYEEFVSLQGSVDFNLYVTLSECHPSTPQESYLAGVPCLISRTSAVFRSDPELWDLTSVDEADNPAAIAEAGSRLLANHSEAIQRAALWMKQADQEGAAGWLAFIGS